MVTGETLTDEIINTLLAEFRAQRNRVWHGLCHDALMDPSLLSGRGNVRRAHARARLAALWNSREAAKEKP